MNRTLVIITPSKNNKNYIEAINEYKKKIKSFDKRFVNLKVIKSNNIFNILLIGFDGEIKKKYKKFNTKKIINDIESMPMGQYYKF